MAHRVPNMLEEHRANHLDANKTSSKLDQQPPVTPSHMQHRPPRMAVHDRRRHPRRSKHYHGGATPTILSKEVGVMNAACIDHGYLA